MFNDIYRFLAHVGALVAAIAKAHELWISAEDPITIAIKILGILLIVWFLFDENLLQSEDR